LPDKKKGPAKTDPLFVPGKQERLMVLDLQLGFLIVLGQVVMAMCGLLGESLQDCVQITGAQ
jgi:hypothetical protein